MTRSEQKQIAKDILLDAIACAYYQLEDRDDLSEDEKDDVINYIHKYGKAMANRIGETYYTL